MSLEMAKLNIKAPTPGTRCAFCGSAEVSSLPSFAIGCGQAYRAIADDVACRRCGRMGPPVYTSHGNGKPPAKETQTVERNDGQKPRESE